MIPGRPQLLLACVSPARAAHRAVTAAPRPRCTAKPQQAAVSFTSPVDDAATVRAIPTDGGYSVLHAKGGGIQCCLQP